MKPAITDTQSGAPAASAVRYDDDHYSWVGSQIALLRAGRNGEIDAVNLAEELRDVGLRVEDELAEAIIDIISRIMSWDHEPTRREPYCAAVIKMRRRDVDRLMRRSPGLQGAMRDLLPYCYDIGRLRFLAGNELPESETSVDCPYSFEDLLNRPV